MPVPRSSIPTPHRWLRIALGWLVLLVAMSAFARGPEPPLRIPLENFGFQPLSHEFLLNGSSMLTLHYVDDKHLLLTFVARRLIPRLPNEPEDDQDRIVDALLLELPTGRVLARTSWHLHDHSQYLWSLGHGHFLLRVRDTLTTFAPLANLSTGDPFAQQPFLVSPDRRFAVLIVSPDADLLIVETVKRTPPAPKPKTPLFGPTPPAQAPQLTERDPVQINFYRVHAGDDGGPVQAVSAGVMKSVKTGDVPVTTAGYLAVVDQGNQHWAFDFHSYAGKTNELSPFDSSCSPAPIFVSHSEFIAFGCRNNSQTMQQIGGFNMRGEEMWEQGLFGDFIAPSLAYAPSGGRFALSRILLRNSVVSDQPISADEVSAQAVVVYQTGTGKQLLRADCSPVERASQNFALSPDGLSLAVVHADAIEVYNLPPLTDKDAAAVKLAQSSAPADSNLPVHASPSADTDSAAQPASVDASTAATNAPPDSNQTQPDNSAATTQQPPATDPAAPAPQTSGDAPPEQRRASPTLYTLPDDKAPAKPKDTPQ
jgi:hypothetical protein